MKGTECCWDRNTALWLQFPNYGCDIYIEHSYCSSFSIHQISVLRWISNSKHEVITAPICNPRNLRILHSPRISKSSQLVFTRSLLWHTSLPIFLFCLGQNSISVTPSIRPSVHPSICPSVCPSVRLSILFNSSQTRLFNNVVSRRGGGPLH